MVAALVGCAGLCMCGLSECPADARISGELRALFAQSPALGPPNLISIQTVHGVVYLRGMLSTPYQIAEAASIAAQVRGVMDVENLLYMDNSR